MQKVVLAALRKQMRFSLAQLAAACRQHEGGESMGTTTLAAYLSGRRPIGDVHFGILCKVLRIDPESVYTSRYLAGGRAEPLPAS
jgi:transcriptional regulator with XRE-family HTH domain